MIGFEELINSSPSPIMQYYKEYMESIEYRYNESKKLVDNLPKVDDLSDDNLPEGFRKCRTCGEAVNTLMIDADQDWCNFDCLQRLKNQNQKEESNQ